MAYGFHQGYSTQHCLLAMVEKWRQCLDNGGVSRTLLTDLSILHDLLIAKLAAYGFDYNSLQMLQSYLSNRKQKKKLMMHIVTGFSTGVWEGGHL